jgi:hypothetical protein
MKWGTAAFDAHSALSAVGGERLHPKYEPGASHAMMASVKLVRPESEQDYADIHSLAVAELGPGLATLEEIKRVDALTDAALWAVKRHGQVTGFLAPLALTLAGRDALTSGTFDGAHIQAKWVARIGEPLAGFYCWCYAGKDQVTRGALVLALRKLIDTHFPDLPFFGRDTTEAGARIMRHLGFPPFDATPHLFWRCCSVMDENAA